MVNGSIRSYIEEDFPSKEVSKASAREKFSPAEGVVALHKWWSRKPLVASRAVIYAALVPYPADEIKRSRKQQFILQLCQLANSNLNYSIGQARQDILEAFGGVPPKVLDPFGGGGSIPLEALRLGCETDSNDLNPVAVLIQKCSLEYPQKFGDRLLRDVELWGNWLLEETQKELGQFYVAEKDSFIPVGYIWFKTIPCQNPSCKKIIPLIYHCWLLRNAKTRVALFPYVTDDGVQFKIVGTGYEPMPKDFDPDKGTVARAVAVCPCCGSSVDADTIKALFQTGAAGQQLVGVEVYRNKVPGKRFRIVTSEDLGAYNQAEKRLAIKRQELIDQWGIDPVPDEPITQAYRKDFNGVKYGLTTWGDFFNARQLLCTITFVEKVRIAYEKIKQSGCEEEYAKAVTAYLAFVVDRLTYFNSQQCLLTITSGSIANSFARSSLPMLWDYIEGYPWSGSTGSSTIALKGFLSTINTLSTVSRDHVVVTNISAMSLDYPDNTFDAIVTDPPYYDLISYSQISDFFYVWLKRMLGHIFPELFSTALTPKREEIAVHPKQFECKRSSKEFFERMLKKAFQEMFRVLKLNGIAVVIFAHKSSRGWRTLIGALSESGFVITAVYSLRTEQDARLSARRTASLASSLYVVVRKLPRQAETPFSAIREELTQRLTDKLDEIPNEGIGGTDVDVATLGVALSVLGRYRGVLDQTGNIMQNDTIIHEVRSVVSDILVQKALSYVPDDGISSLTRFYVIWRKRFGVRRASIRDAQVLAQECGIKLIKDGISGFISIKGSYVRVLGPVDREEEQLKDSNELIDILHYALILWKRGELAEIVEVLVEWGIGHNEVFYIVGQAISVSLPEGKSEKSLLDGFLTNWGRFRIQVQEAINGDAARQFALF